jgi:2-oxoisovalerate dehydrogenase E2 component (dihydrolipoyl transacylase)
VPVTAVAASQVQAAPVAPTSAPPAPSTAQPQAPVANKPSAATGDRAIAAPAVRRRAWELGVDLQAIPGTGPGGRITQADLEAFSAGAATGNAGSDQRFAKNHDEEVIPVIGLRRKIAQKMQEAKRRIPHFTYVEEIDVTELEDLRLQLNARHGANRGRLTLLPFLIRAPWCWRVRQHPEVNARYDDDAGVLTRYGAIHMGLATQTEAGLMVPVIRHAESLDLWACAAEVVRLAAGCAQWQSQRGMSSMGLP